MAMIYQLEENERCKQGSKFKLGSKWKYLQVAVLGTVECAAVDLETSEIASVITEPGRHDNHRQRCIKNTSDHTKKYDAR